MKENEYVRINKTAIQKRIEELEKHYNEKANINDDQWCSIIAGQITGLKQILSQSTPLIPEIEKAFDVGINSQFEVQEKNLTDKEEIRDYHQKKLINISNLKLDI